MFIEMEKWSKKTKNRKVRNGKFNKTTNNLKNKRNPKRNPEIDHITCDDIRKAGSVEERLTRRINATQGRITQLANKINAKKPKKKALWKRWLKKILDKIYKLCV